MDAAATEGRHRTCKPRKMASVQSRRYSSRAPPAGPSLRSGGGTARQPPRPHPPAPRPPASRGHRAQEATVDLPSRKGESRKKGQRPDERGLEGGEPLREGQGGPGRRPESPRLRLAGWQEQSATREACGQDAPGAATPDCRRRTDAHRARAGCRGPGRASGWKPPKRTLTSAHASAREGFAGPGELLAGDRTKRMVRALFAGHSSSHGRRTGRRGLENEGGRRPLAPSALLGPGGRSSAKPGATLSALTAWTAGQGPSSAPALAQQASRRMLTLARPGRPPQHGLGVN